MEVTRSRAAILPFPGDPFLLNFWLGFYDRVWGKEIDKLYIYLNSPIEREVVDYIFNRARRSQNVEVIYHNQQIEHGEAINRTLDTVGEEFVMLIEDDAIIFKPGMVSECFERLESGKLDIVGSKRGSCSLEIIDAAYKKFTLKPTPWGDDGPNFWPCYFFSRVETLKKTGRNFGARGWKRGEKIESLDYVVEVDSVAGDTFVETSLELRAQIPESRIGYVPQYHLHPDDYRNKEYSKTVFDGQAPWLHIGSLSSGISGLLRDKENRPLARRGYDKPSSDISWLSHSPNTQMERREYERRVAFWDLAWQERELLALEDFKDAYRHALDFLIANFGLSRSEIKKMQAMYKQLWSL